MLADVCLHSSPAALHYYLGSGLATPVLVTHASRVQSALSATSGRVAVGP